VFKLGIAIIKMALAWQYCSLYTSMTDFTSSELDHFDGNFWPFPGSSPDLSINIQCQHMLLTTGSDAHSRDDLQFAGQKPPRRTIGNAFSLMHYASSTDYGQTPVSICSIQPCMVSIAISVCMFFPYSKNAVAEFVN
jgi:hypothetical protein